MGEKSPNFEKMVNESIDEETKNLPETGEKPLEFNEEGELKSEEESALDNLEASQVTEAQELVSAAGVGAEFAQKIDAVFANTGADAKASRDTDLMALKGEFLAGIKEASPDMSDGDALTMLREQLGDFHDAHKNLGQDELASEIDSFGRSLETSDTINTEAGQEFVGKLESGDFSSLEDAMNALDHVKDNIPAGQEEAMNAEFNLLYAAIQEKFGEGKKQEGEGAFDADDNLDDDVDGMFDALTG